MTYSAINFFFRHNQMYAVTVFNHLPVPIHVNQYKYATNLSMQNLYKPNSGSVYIEPGHYDTFKIDYASKLFIADKKIYNAYRIVPDLMAEFYDGIEFHLWESKQAIKGDHKYNVVTAKLLPNTKLWYIFSDTGYNIIIVLVTSIIVAAAILIFNRIKSLLDI
jgi:hypothetical protein